MMRHRSLVHRVIPLFAACLIGVGGTAQDRGSLTEDFPGLSAKERARIAAKENADAAKDAAFQAVMSRSELAFREGRYDVALQGYKEARTMRPYNVHPKVKIEDLQVLIAKRAAQADTIPPAVEAAPPEPLPAAPDPVVAVVAEPEVEAPPAVVPLVVQAVEQPVLEPPATVQPEPAPPEPAEKRSPVVATPVAGSPAPVPTEQPDVYLPDGITERQYREGNAFTIERIVTENGHSTVYKRVAHPFATFYFQDGQAIDERVWNARFQGK